MVAIDLITEHIRMKLQQPDLRRIYHNLVGACSSHPFHCLAAPRALSLESVLLACIPKSELLLCEVHCQHQGAELCHYCRSAVLQHTCMVAHSSTSPDAFAEITAGF